MARRLLFSLLLFLPLVTATTSIVPGVVEAGPRSPIDRADRAAEVPLYPFWVGTISMHRVLHFQTSSPTGESSDYTQEYQASATAHEDGTVTFTNSYRVLNDVHNRPDAVCPHEIIKIEAQGTGVVDRPLAAINLADQGLWSFSGQVADASPDTQDYRARGAYTLDACSDHITYPYDIVLPPAANISGDSGATHVAGTRTETDLNGLESTYTADLTLFIPNACPTGAAASTTTARGAPRASAPACRVTGQVLWAASIPQRGGQGVANAIVELGNQSVVTDANGNYTVNGIAPGNYTLTARLPIVEAPSGQVALNVASKMQVTIAPETTSLPPLDTFASQGTLTLFGSTSALTALAFNENGLTAETDTNIPYGKNQAFDVAVSVKVVTTSTGGTILLRAESGTPVEWLGQTLTLRQFEDKITYTKSTARASDTVKQEMTLDAGGRITIGGLKIDASFSGTGDVDANATRINLVGKGTAQALGAALRFDEIKYTDLYIALSGVATLVNQKSELPFSALVAFVGDPTTSTLNLSTPTFDFDGHKINAILTYFPNTRRFRLLGQGKVTVGGEEATISLGGTVGSDNPADNPKIIGGVVLPVGGGTMDTAVFYNIQTGELSGVGTYKYQLPLCPGDKPADDSVSVGVTREAINFTLDKTVAISCGPGGAKIAHIQINYNGSTASVKQEIPFLLNGTPASWSLEGSSRGVGKDQDVQVNLKFTWTFGGPKAPGSQSMRQAADATIHVLLVDGAGRRSGYDASTGQYVNEIPGAQYVGIVNGIDTFNLPARLGGFAAALTSDTAQQATVESSVGGQAVRYTASVTPGTPTWVAAVASRTGTGQPAVNAQAGSTPTTSGPTSCTPRPPVRVTAVGDGARRLTATLTADTSGQASGNGIHQLRIGQVTNAMVDVGELTNVAAGTTVDLPTHPSQVTLVVWRQATGQPTQVPIVVVDDCGEWPTFVGGGANGF